MSNVFKMYRKSSRNGHIVLIAKLNKKPISKKNNNYECRLNELDNYYFVQEKRLFSTCNIFYLNSITWKQEIQQTFNEKALQDKQQQLKKSPTQQTTIKNELYDRNDRNEKNESKVSNEAKERSERNENNECRETNENSLREQHYDSTTSLLSEMKNYATNFGLRKKSKNHSLDGKQTFVKNSLFLLKLKEIMNSGDIGKMNNRQLTEYILKVYNEFFESYSNHSISNSYVSKKISNISSQNNNSVSEINNSNSYTSTKQNLLFDRGNKKKQDTSINNTTNSSNTSNSIHNQNTDQQVENIPVYPDQKSFQILFRLFTNRKYLDLFDFEYFTSKFLNNIFLYHIHLIDESFIEEIFQSVVSSNQILGEGLTLFMLYSNYIDRVYNSNIEKQKHLFKCFILLLKESIKLENVYVMKILLEIADSKFKNTVLGSIDESLSLEHQNQLYICLMDLYARSGEIEAAATLFQERILSPNISNDTMSQVITTLLTPYTVALRKSYSNEERKNAINTILDKAPNGNILDVVVADSILELYIIDREWDKCKWFIERFYNLEESLREEISIKPFESRLTSDKKLSPTYMSLIKIFLVYSTFGEANLLQKYYNLIVKASSRKDHTRLANFVLLAHLRSGDAQKSLLMFQELFRSKWQTNSYATCIPDVDTWKITLQACKATGARRMHEAVQQELNIEMMRKQREINEF